MLLLILAAACGVPVVDNSEDRYDERRPGPEALVDADGDYVGGWWSDWTGEINPEDASGPDSALKGWIHLSFDLEDWFVVTNLADLSKAANTALLVVDKRTGELHSVSLRYAFGDNVLEVGPAWDDFYNPADGSSSRVEADGTVSFAIYAEQLSFEGSAVPVGEPFIQTTRSVPGYGWLQFYENLEIVEATLDLGDGPIEVPAGTLGAMDRTLGHRSNIQNWNWLSLIGPATDAETGETEIVSVQVARDQEGANPKVDGLKYPVWVGDELFKLPDLSFEYEVLDEQTRETSEWRVRSPEGEPDALDLTVQPDFHRRDQQDFLWFVHTDFNQYYGPATGTLTHDGRTWEIQGLFAVCEDSLLVL